MTDPTPPKPKSGCGCAERREKIAEWLRKIRDRPRPPNTPPPK